MTSEMESVIASPELELTMHARTRFSKRGFCDEEACLVVLFGTEVEGGYLMLWRDVAVAELEMKRPLEQMHRLVGWRVIVDGGRVITAYRTRPRKERALLRDEPRRTSLRPHYHKREGK